jgi:hypothetical protein
MGCSPKPRIVPGQVFIVTGGLGVVPLPLIDVIAITERSALAHLAQADSLLLVRRDELERDLAVAQKEHEKLQARSNTPTLMNPNWQAKYSRGEINLDTYLQGDPEVRGTLIDSRRSSNRITRLLEQIQELSVADLVFSLPLPAYVDSARTNADGRFVVKIPANVPCVLVARGDRRTFDTTEHYRWFIRIPSTLDSAQVVMLNNDNFVGERSVASLLR